MSKINKDYIEVSVFDEKFKLIYSDNGAEDIKVLSDLVNCYIENVKSKHPNYSYKRVAILAALNISSDFVNFKKKHSKLNHSISDSNEYNDICLKIHGINNFLVNNFTSLDN